MKSLTVYGMMLQVITNKRAHPFDFNFLHNKGGENKRRLIILSQYWIITSITVAQLKFTAACNV